jgi:K+-transporting ATPase ATPase A chain
MAWVFRRPTRAKGQDWREYATTAVVFGVVGAVFLYGLLRLQGHLPLNPDDRPGVDGVVSLHTAVSFVTSTNWQFYAGESTMSHLSQMAGLAVQNFVAPAVGLAVLVACCRAFTDRPRATLGNFWTDLARGLAYVILPLAALSAVVLMSLGVVQTFSGTATAATLEGGEQAIARGPVATQVAIRHLGTNGGGFYNTNAATPFENPSGLTNAVELFLQLLLPVACVFMFGRLVRGRRQAWTIFGALFGLVAIGVAIALPAELYGSKALRDAGVELADGNMSDKEVRFGAAESAMFASATTAAAGSGVDAGHDALTPIGGGVPLTNMYVGLLGGVGTGMLMTLLKIVFAVFIAGLLIGRTPEYLGKKIESREVKLAVTGAMFTPLLALALTALSVGTDLGRSSIFNPGAHGFGETLYAYTSQVMTNGSAFAGFGLTDLSAYAGIVAMTLGRFVPLIAVLALAASLASKRTVPPSLGTFRTDTSTFGVLLVAATVILSGLTILPALVLGPVVESLQ